MQTLRTTSRKLILAAAVSAIYSAPAVADTSIKIQGTIDVYAGSMRNAGDTASTATLNSSGMTTSWVGLSGTKDFDKDLKGGFNLGAFLRPDSGSAGRFNGDTFWARDANVTLSGKFGQVTAGRGLAPNFLPMILTNPFGDSFTFSPLVLHHQISLFNATGWSSSITGDTGWSKEIIYSTPDFNGLVANFHYQFGGVSGDRGKRNIGANMLYFKGPFQLTAFVHSVKVNNPTDPTPGIVQSIGGLNAAEQKAWFLGTGYDFGPAKVFATYDRVTHDVPITDKTWSLGASVPMGKGKIMLGWAETKRDVGATPTVKRDTVTLGYDYQLYESTDVYANVMNDKITGFNTGNSFGVGIRYRF